MGSFFDMAFWQQLVVTFCSVALGIPTGVWLTRWGHRQEKAHQEQAERERRQQLLQGIRDSVVYNCGLLETFVDNSTDVIVDHVDLTVLDATAALKYEVLNDIGLASEVDKFRARLRDIELGLQLYNRIGYDISINGEKLAEGVVERLAEAPGSKTAEEMVENMGGKLGFLLHMREGVVQKATACLESSEALLAKIDQALGTPKKDAAPRDPIREAIPIR